MNTGHDASGVIARYADRLPVTHATPRLSLGEGSTPLVHAPRLAEWVGVASLWLKYEGANPTGSFKDRGMALAVARAIEGGARTVLCASTGNTSASAAAYAAKAGLRAVVLLPAGKVAAGKLAQAVACGAEIVMVDGSFDDALTITREVADDGTAALVNSVNPFRIEGQTTAAFEIVEALGDAPDVLALPVGNGGNVTAYALGFRRDASAGNARQVPVIVGAQAEGAAPFVRGASVEQPETVATAIRIGRPATWEPAIAAVRDSGGAFTAVSDALIMEAYAAIPALAGIFCEPASAASVAALRVGVGAGTIARSARCVCVLTGNGMKDPAAAGGLGGGERVVGSAAELRGILRG